MEILGPLAGCRTVDSTTSGLEMLTKLDPFLSLSLSLFLLVFLTHAKLSPLSLQSVSSGRKRQTQFLGNSAIEIHPSAGADPFGSWPEEQK